MSETTKNEFMDIKKEGGVAEQRRTRGGRHDPFIIKPYPSRAADRQAQGIVSENFGKWPQGERATAKNGPV